MKRYVSNVEEMKKKVNRGKVYEKYGHKLYEQSLSRIWQHSKEGFFLISAFRDKYTEEENLVRHDKIKRL